MNKLNFHQIGWAIAAAILGTLMAAGFQEASNKTGVVDIAKVVEGSNFGKNNQSTFQAMKTSREDLLKFLDENRVITMEQAQRLRAVSLKPNPTAEEKAEGDRIRADAVASTKRLQELNAKANLTPEERNLMQEFAQRGQRTADTAQQWFQEFTQEMQRWADDQRVVSLNRARGAIQEVAKAQGYTVVFEVGVAPYGANDLTDSALQAMNAKQ